MVRRCSGAGFHRVAKNRPDYRLGCPWLSRRTSLQSLPMQAEVVTVVVLLEQGRSLCPRRGLPGCSAVRGRRSERARPGQGGKAGGGSAVHTTSSGHRDGCGRASHGERLRVPPLYLPPLKGPAGSWEPVFHGAVRIAIVGPDQSTRWRVSVWLRPFECLRHLADAPRRTRRWRHR